MRIYRSFSLCIWQAYALAGCKFLPLDTGKERTTATDQGVRSPSDLRADRTESISSIKMTEGCRAPATANSARTIFSPSPIHLLVREEADIEKKVARMLAAMALPISVLPVPGGPNSSSPLGGALAPCAALSLH